MLGSTKNMAIHTETHPSMDESETNLLIFNVTKNVARAMKKE